MFAVRLAKSLEKRLDALAKKTSRSQASHVREAVLQHISNMEDLYRAHSVKERISNGKERIHTLDEVIGELGFERSEFERGDAPK